MKSTHIIGVVGGVGPYAGLDLVRKIFDQTLAGTDQEHLPVALLSYGDRIEDRTAFITGRSHANPAFAIDGVLKDLESLGCSVAGIACNAAHAPSIFNVIVEEMRKRKSRLRLLHIVEETARFLQEQQPVIRTLGLLATTGAVQSGVYQQVLGAKGFQVLLPDETTQHESVHQPIYDPEFGIKARSSPVTEEARRRLLQAAALLEQQGAEAVILGCTEIPLAITQRRLGRAIVLDPSLILARALIHAVRPDKLRPLESL